MKTGRALRESATMIVAMIASALCGLALADEPFQEPIRPVLNNDQVNVAQGQCKDGNLAFPDARGFGQCATGWRGGRVVKVTNLNDSGPGSLREECIDVDGPRVCLFDVGGTIEVNQPLSISSGSNNAGGNIYIAGQSAPEDSGGVQIRLAAINGSASTLQVLQSNHILIRHLRLRPGEGQVSTASVSGILIRNGEYVMLDHLSVFYATDQNVTTTAQAFGGLAPLRGTTRFFTLQDSISAFGLANSNHPSAPHSKGALFCAMTLGNFNLGDRCGFHSVIRNYFAHNRDRNPEIKATGEPWEIIDNIIYDPTSAYVEMADSLATSSVFLANNAAFEGFDTRDTNPPHLFTCREDASDPAIKCDIYPFGNTDEDNRATLSTGNEVDVIDPDSPDFTLLTSPPETAAGSTISSEDLAGTILATVGATAPSRDALDTLVTGQCCGANSGTSVDAPSDVTGAGLVGGYPTLAAGTPPIDADSDGVPNDWETALGTSPNFYDPWDDFDGNGWTNLEDYLNCRADGLPASCDPRQ